MKQSVGDRWKIALWITAYLLLLAGLIYFALPRTLTVTQLETHRRQYDGQRLSVAGTMRELGLGEKQQQGNYYYRFRLTEGEQSVDIIVSHGRPAAREGDRMVVTGLYKRELQARDGFYNNIIDATHGSVVLQKQR